MNPALEQDFQLALTYHNQGKIAEAEALYLKILQQDIHHVKSLTNLGVIYKKRGQYVAAIQLYQKVLELIPDYPVVHYNLALVYELDGKFDQAIAHFQKVLAAQPQNIEILNLIAGVYYKNRELPQAVDCYRQILSINPNQSQIYFKLSTLLRQQELLQEAETVVQQWLQIEPKSANAIICLGGIYEQLGKFDLAQACYQTGLELNPDYPEIPANLGLLAIRTKNFLAAKSYFETALTLKPDYEKAQRWRTYLEFLLQAQRELSFNYQGTLIKFYISGENLDLELKQTNAKTFYELQELEFVRDTLQSPQTLVDVGANTGNHTLYFAKILQAQKVIPIEFQPNAIAFLKTNLSLNQVDNVDLSKLGYAIGKKRGKASSKPHITGDLCLTEVCEDETGDIEIIPLDELIQEPVDLIKIDVQGLEIEVLESAKVLLETYHPDLLIEINRKNEQDCLYYLATIDYRVIRRFNYWGYTNFYLQYQHPS